MQVQKGNGEAMPFSEPADLAGSAVQHAGDPPRRSSALPIGLGMFGLGPRGGKGPPRPATPAPVPPGDSGTTQIDALRKGNLKIISQAWIDDQGHTVSVMEGVGIYADTFMPCWRSPDGLLQPVSGLPPRHGFAIAQADLDRHAQLKGWKPVTPIPEDDIDPKPTRRRAGAKGGRRKAEVGNGHSALPIGPKISGIEVYGGKNAPPPADPPRSNSAPPTPKKSKKARLLALAEEFQAAHGGRQFTVKEVAEWAIATGRWPADEQGDSPSAPPSAVPLPPSRPPSADPESLPDDDRTTVAIDFIRPNPWQARRDFGAEEIAALAESIRLHGLLQPPLVRIRPKGEGYELVAGERRLRACRQLGWKTIGVSVRRGVTDAQMRRWAYEENTRRADLNPLERAREMQGMLDAGDAAGPSELARLLGLSQGHVSNTLALLKLGQVWQERIISGEITAAHARHLVPYAARPGLLKAITGKIFRYRPKDYKGSVENFGGAVRDAVREVSEPMDGERWSEKLGRRVPAYKPSAEELAKLDVIEVQRYDGRIERRAINVQLWKTLQGRHAAQLAAREETKKGRGKKGGSPQASQSSSSKKPTPAQVKAAAEEERRRKEEQARLTAKKVWRWRINRLREASSRALAGAPAEKRMRVVLYFLVAAEAWHLQGADIWRHNHDREEALGFVMRCDQGFRSGKPWPSIAAIADGYVAKRLASVVENILYDARHGPRVPIPDETVTAIAEHLGVDLRELWKKDQKEAWGKSYYELHTREQLVPIGGELGIFLKAEQKKDVMIRMLMGRDAVLAMPRELRRAKRPAGKP
jgi:ParB/RepB/Spo0J family partition protein